jgi:hypothetical protein
MKQIIYACSFTGRIKPKDGSATALRATTTASSCNLTTTVAAEGVNGARQATAGGKATFESEVTITGATSFRESGTVLFGEGNHRLRSSTVRLSIFERG